MSNGVDEILLTFRQEEHILIVAKNVMILTLAKTKPRKSATLPGFSIPFM